MDVQGDPQVSVLGRWVDGGVVTLAETRGEQPSVTLILLWDHGV